MQLSVANREFDWLVALHTWKNLCMLGTSEVKQFNKASSAEFNNLIFGKFELFLEKW